MTVKPTLIKKAPSKKPRRYHVGAPAQAVVALTTPELDPLDFDLELPEPDPEPTPIITPEASGLRRDDRYQAQGPALDEILAELRADQAQVLSLVSELADRIEALERRLAGPITLHYTPTTPEPERGDPEQGQVVRYRGRPYRFLGVTDQGGYELEFLNGEKSFPCRKDKVTW